MSEDPLALSKISAAPPPADTDYEAICAAVMETDRGRWFLNEYARRNRHADTNVILSAIGRIEAAIRGAGVSTDSSHLRLDLLEMAEVIARTEAAMATIKPDAARGGKSADHSSGERDSTSSGAFGHPNHAPHDKTSTSAEVLAAAERVLDIVWTLREREVDPALCDELHAAASEIHAAAETPRESAAHIEPVMPQPDEVQESSLIDEAAALIAAASEADARGEPVLELQAEPKAAGTAPAAYDAGSETAMAPTASAAAQPEPAASIAVTSDTDAPDDPALDHQSEHQPALTETRPQAPDADAEMAIATADLHAAQPELPAPSVAAAPEDALSEPTVDHPAEPEPAEAAPVGLDADAEPAVTPPVHAAQTEPPTIAADTAIVSTPARPAVFVVFQAADTTATAIVAGTPDAGPAEPPVAAEADAATAPALLQPDPVEAVVADLDTSDPSEPPAAPVESHFEPTLESASSPEPVQTSPTVGEASGDEAAEPTAADGEVDAMVAEIEAAHCAPTTDQSEFSAAPEIEVEPAPSEPIAPALTVADPRPADDNPDLGGAPQPLPPIAEFSVAGKAAAEDVLQVPAVAAPEPEAALPDPQAPPPMVDIATVDEIVTPIVEAAPPAAADPPADTAQSETPAENADEPSPSDEAAPTAVDDIDFLLEPLPGPAAAPPRDAAPPPSERPAPRSEPPLLPLAESDEDVADLFEALPSEGLEAKPQANPILYRPHEPVPEVAQVAAEMLAPASLIAPLSSPEPKDAAADAVMTAAAAPMPEAAPATGKVAAAIVQTEAPPAAVAAPPPRMGARPILAPRVTPTDPMAAVRALSEDELVALFS